MQPDSLNLGSILKRGLSVALIIQTLNFALLYLLQICLARWMGVSDYGVYEYVSTIAITLSFLSGLGISTVALRFIAEYQVKQDWAHLRGVIWGSWGQTLLSGLVLALIGTRVVWIWHDRSPIAFVIPLLLSLWTVPLLALTKLQLEMARSVRRIGLAYAPSLVLYPVLLLIGAVILQQRGQLTSASTIGLSIAISGLVLIMQFGLFQRGLPAIVHQTPPAYELRKWLLMALPLLFIDGSFLVLNQTDSLMIGGLINPESVGIYNAALKTANWVHFILRAVNAIAAPLFASLYAQNQQAELQKLVSTIARWMFYPALLTAIGLMLLAEPVLGLFGPEFVAAKWTMMVLMIGQLVNVGAGSVGYLLNMTGHHNQCAKVVGWSGLLNIILNAVFIPLFGILGAAIATAISMSLWNIWMNRLVVKYLGVNPSIVAALRGSV